MFVLSLLGTLLSLAAYALARSSTGSSVLVILEPKLKQADYSLFFDGLRGNLTFSGLENKGADIMSQNAGMSSRSAHQKMLDQSCSCMMIPNSLT
jgi:hypothetical protein